MSRSDDKSERAFHELVRVLEEAAQAGADSLELEWEGRDLMAFQCLGHAAVGTAPFSRDLQSAVLEEVVQRAGLRRKSKGRMLLTLNEEEYEVLVKQYESFGESAFILKLNKGGRRSRPAR
jgi:hypothetical protein